MIWLGTQLQNLWGSTQFSEKRQSLLVRMSLKRATRHEEVAISEKVSVAAWMFTAGGKRASAPGVHGLPGRETSMASVWGVQSCRGYETEPVPSVYLNFTRTDLLTDTNIHFTTVSHEDLNCFLVNSITCISRSGWLGGVSVSLWKP